MVQLADGDIKTREVLDWKGVHLFHFMGSSCSQKARIFLNLKGIPWESHLVDIRGNENFRARYLGINPRGLLPCLVYRTSLGNVYVHRRGHLCRTLMGLPGDTSL